ncbi:MAG: dependent oxidoreductase, partial [Candidatus Binatus sp.]|nr:dependent oxidoreductase [Candidatus Binatus sp.]
MAVAKDVIVIGAGFAGLSAAVALAERNFRVMVLEGKPVPGGRA